jgi:general secretion pathway protein H
MRRSKIGFTLIEILVVLLIISIVAGAMVLTVGSNHNRQIEQFANELVETILYAEERAMLEPSIIRLDVTEDEIRFFRYEPKPDREIEPWVLMTDRFLSARVIPDFIEMKVVVLDNRIHEEDESQDKMPIIISSNGDITPFTIYLSLPNEKPRYALVGEANGQITNKFLQ